MVNLTYFTQDSNLCGYDYPCCFLTLKDIPPDYPIVVARIGVDPCWTVPKPFLGQLCYSNAGLPNSCTIAVSPGYYYIQQVRGAQVADNYVMIAGNTTIQYQGGSQDPESVSFYRGRLISPDEAPIVEALVELSGVAINNVISRSVDEAGTFRFDFVLPGTYHLRVLAPGYAVQTRRIVLSGNLTDETIKLELMQLPGCNGRRQHRHGRK